MKNYHKEMKDKVKIILYISIFIILILSLKGKQNYIDMINKWLPSILISIVTTSISQIILQKFTGTFFEKILLPIKIGEFRFYISLFLILTIIIKLILF